MDEDISETNFYFFVDGLDEFEEDIQERFDYSRQSAQVQAAHTTALAHRKSLIDLIKHMTSSNHVKVCVTSRPWTEFEDAFKSTPSLMLQHLTYSDIKQYVESNFHKNDVFISLESREPTYAPQLIDAVVQKAEGVFL